MVWRWLNTAALEDIKNIALRFSLNGNDRKILMKSRAESEAQMEQKYAALAVISNCKYKHYMQTLTCLTAYLLRILITQGVYVPLIYEIKPSWSLNIEISFLIVATRGL